MEWCILLLLTVYLSWQKAPGLTCSPSTSFLTVLIYMLVLAELRARLAYTGCMPSVGFACWVCLCTYFMWLITTQKVALTLYACFNYYVSSFNICIFNAFWPFCVSAAITHGKDDLCCDLLVLFESICCQAVLQMSVFTQLLHCHFTQRGTCNGKSTKFTIQVSFYFIVYYRSTFNNHGNKKGKEESRTRHSYLT